MNEVFFSQFNGFHDFLYSKHYGSRTRNDYEKYVLQFLQWCKNNSKQESEPLEENILDYLKLHRPRNGSRAQFNMMRAAIHNY